MEFDPCWVVLQREAPLGWVFSARLCPTLVLHSSRTRSLRGTLARLRRDRQVAYIRFHSVIDINRRVDDTGIVRLCGKSEANSETTRMHVCLRLVLRYELLQFERTSPLSRGEASTPHLNTELDQTRASNSASI